MRGAIYLQAGAEYVRHVSSIVKHRINSLKLSPFSLPSEGLLLIDKYPWSPFYHELLLTELEDMMFADILHELMNTWHYNQTSTFYDQRSKILELNFKQLTFEWIWML